MFREAGVQLPKFSSAVAAQQIPHLVPHIKPRRVSMKPFRIASAAATLLVFAVALAAQSAHTWVSSTGSDANGNGTTAKPYATFAQALSNTAAAGIVSVLGPGDYGPVTITQSVTIDGTGGGSIGFAGDGEGIYIDPSAPASITLRNLTMNGGGTGSDAIFIASSGTTNPVYVVIDGCLIGGFSQIGVGLGSESPMYMVIRNTTISGGELSVRTFQNGTAAPVTGYDHVSLDHVTIQGASSAGVFMRNGNVDISNSNITGSVGAGVVGVQADTYATVNLQNSMVTSNTNGICIYVNSSAIIDNTTVADNGTNVEGCGGTVTGAGGAGPSPKLPPGGISAPSL
jgi:hypothetical protein